MDIADWLHTLNLGQYAAAFRENSVGLDVLSSLTVDDLKDLGVTAVGDRRRLMNAIAALRSGAENVGPQNVEEQLAERRQLTVMFCDLAGSTALSNRLDPEDLSSVVRTYQSTVRSTISRFGGFIARYVGDGVLIYFGWPEAHETDAESAVRAALAVVAAVSENTIHGEHLSIRIGIATGLVVVGSSIGEGDSRQQTAIGETPNIAARLQSLAAPNTVVIAAGTRRLVGDLFDYRDLGMLDIKGIATPVPAWQVLRPRIIESRFEALHGSTLNLLVGRNDEIDVLLGRWMRARAGDGQVVLISGEPGLGKSRLTEALAARLHAESYVRLRYFCSPYHQDSALFPFVDQLSRAAGFTIDEPSSSKLVKLSALLARAAPLNEDVAFLTDLLSLPTSEQHPLPNLSPQRKKERTLHALVHRLEGLTRQQPVLMVFEDAHWIDPSSRELLDLIVEQVSNLPLLLIVTFRPEFRPDWIGEPHVTMLTLNRLDLHDRTVLVNQIAEGKSLPDEVVSQIVERTDGVPLFIEELTKSILESGLLREDVDRYVLDRALSPFSVPTSLHDSLMARLDRLGSVRRVAQIGAAIGREFSYKLLLTVSRLPSDELQDALTQLVSSELVFERGTPPDAAYAFKHVLVQDAIHGSLLRNARQDLHTRIAEALQTHSPELMDSQPEMFALHYAEAGLIERSVAFWGKAGHSSAARSAMVEAVAQFQKGLDQLALLPETPERQRQELDFWGALGAALRFTKGQATPQMGHAYTRARELWERLGSPSEFLHIPYGESFYRTYRGELDVAQRLDEGLLRLSLQRDDAAGLVLGHASAGRTLIYAGRFAAARAHLEEVLTIYDPNSHRSLGQQSGSHPRVSAQGQLGSRALWLS